MLATSIHTKHGRLQVVDLKQEVPDLRSGEIPPNLTPVTTFSQLGQLSLSSSLGRQIE